MLDYSLCPVSESWKQALSTVSLILLFTCVLIEERLCLLPKDFHGRSDFFAFSWTVQMGDSIDASEPSLGTI